VKFDQAKKLSVFEMDIIFCHCNRTASNEVNLDRGGEASSFKTLVKRWLVLFLKVLASALATLNLLLVVLNDSRHQF